MNHYDFRIAYWLRSKNISALTHSRAGLAYPICHILSMCTIQALFQKGNSNSNLGDQFTLVLNCAYLFCIRSSQIMHLAYALNGDQFDPKQDELLNAN